MSIEFEENHLRKSDQTVVRDDVETGYKQRQAEVLQAIETMLRGKFFITHTTLQAECTVCAEGPVIKELNHTVKE